MDTEMILSPHSGFSMPLSVSIGSGLVIVTIQATRLSSGLYIQGY
jgi:hypothetical protein